MYLVNVSKKERILLNKGKSILLENSYEKKVTDGILINKLLKNFIMGARK